MSNKQEIRIALMLSGQPRALSETYPYIKKNIIDCNVNIDIFIHCWHNPIKEGTIFEQSSYQLTNSTPNLIPSTAVGLLNELYKPTDIFTEPQEDFSSRVSDLSDVPLNKLVNPFAIFSAWTSKKRCYELVEKYENINRFKYDYVISTRTDCLLLRKIKVAKLSKNKLHIHGHSVRGTFGVVDNIYISSSEHMRKIVRIADKIEEYVRDTKLWNAESQLLQELTLNQIPVEGHNWYPILVRGDGVKSSIKRTLLTYIKIKIIDSIRDIPIIKDIYHYIRNKYRGPYITHTDWSIDKKTRTLKRYFGNN